MPPQTAVNGDHHEDRLEDETTPIMIADNDFHDVRQDPQGVRTTTNTPIKPWWFLLVGAMLGVALTLLLSAMGPSASPVGVPTPDSDTEATAAQLIDDDDDATTSTRTDIDDDDYAWQRNGDEYSRVANQLLKECFAQHDYENASVKRHANEAAAFSATVLIMRHCDKFGETTDAQGNEHCNVIGKERAQFIAQELFPRRWPPPSFLYATSPDRTNHCNYREVETIQPLADKYKLPIQSAFDVNHVKELTADVCLNIMDAKDTKVGAKQLLIVVSWKHSDMPNVAQHLGCGPGQGCPMEYPAHSFDEVWELKFLFDPTEETPWSVYGYVTQQNFDPLQWENRPSEVP